MEEDHGASKPGNSPGPGPEVKTGERIATKEFATERVHSGTVLNEMRDILGEVTIGTARKILDFANSREIRV